MIAGVVRIGKLKSEAHGRWHSESRASASAAGGAR